jgi:hypothetical protein
MISGDKYANHPKTEIIKMVLNKMNPLLTIKEKVNNTQVEESIANKIFDILQKDSIKNSKNSASIIDTNQLVLTKNKKIENSINKKNFGSRLNAGLQWSVFFTCAE